MARRSLALRVGAPCPVRWEQMAGDDRTRYCGQCRQNVYNVASFSEDEVRALIQQREGRVCVRLQRRADGTVITRDCWHAVRRARERLAATVMGVAVMAAGFWGGVGAMTRWFSPRRGPTCPSPLEPRAELPEPEIPDWLKKGAPQEQGARGPKRTMRPRRAPVKPPGEDVEVESVTMGVMLLDD